MTRLFLDTEFNGFGGKLISMALVPEDPTLPEFYREVEMSGQLEPWVRDHVVPHLVLIPVSFSKFQTDLADYLWKMAEVTIVADWPDDIRYFCESLITGPGMMLPFINNLKFELDFGIEYESVVPHNALHDARAIRDCYVSKGNNK